MPEIKKHENPDHCDNIIGLHTTPKQWIPDIKQNGFKLPKDVPSQHSSGKGASENDILFFERKNNRGVRYILGWKQSLEGNRNISNGIIQVSIHSCNHLDKTVLKNNRHELAMKGTQFIMDAQGYPESKRAWSEDFLGRRLESYDDPFEFLRKVATDSTHGILDASGKMVDVKEYNIGEVMTYLGFDTASGYSKSHFFSPDKEDRNAPTNEIIVANPKLIYDIQEITPKELCEKYNDDIKMSEVCQKLGIK